MSETSGVGYEVTRQVEVKLPQPHIGKRSYQISGNTVEVNIAKFSQDKDPDSTPKKAAVLIPGWPMKARAPIIWGQPAMLSREYGVTTYAVDGGPKGRFKGSATDLEIVGIGLFITELQEKGLEEVTLYGHSMGAVKVVNLALLLEQANPNFKINVILINPMGMYADDPRAVMRDYFIEADKVEKALKNPARPSHPMPDVYKSIAQSIMQDVVATPLQIKQVAEDQTRLLSEFNQNLTKIQSSVTVMLAEQDPVSKLKRHFPPEELKGRVASTMPVAEVKHELEESDKWERLSEDEKREYGSKEAFVNDYMSRTRETDQMIRTRKAREQYLSDNVFPHVRNLRLIVASKFAHHNAYGVDRPKQLSHVIADTLRSKA